MCGATSAQEDLQGKQAAFYDEATKEAETTFGEQQTLLAQIRQTYDPIIAKGPNAPGFSDAERNDLNAGAIDRTSTNYAAAAKAAGETIAARGGGNIPMPTGGEEQLRAEIAASAAGELSKEQSKIKEDDYAQGYREFTQATDAELATSSQYNPAGFSNAATNAGSAASTTANEIAQANNSWVNAAIGAAGSLGGAAISENPGNIFG